MATFNIKANSFETSYFGDDIKNYQGIKVVPSVLMKTTSYDFLLEKKLEKSVGVYDLDISINSDDSSVLDINKLEGHFESSIGKHYIKLLEKMEIDMSSLDDNEDYNLAIEVVYNETNVETADYPLTDININVEKTSDSINGVILASFHFQDDEISELSVKDITTIYQASQLNYLYSQGFILADSDVDRPLMGATYGCDTSDSGFNITLPANPNIGDYFLVLDIKGTFNDNPVTLLRNGKTIMGKDEDYNLDIDNLQYKVIYVGNDDWRVV